MKLFTVPNNTIYSYRNWRSSRALAKAADRGHAVGQLAGVELMSSVSLRKRGKRFVVRIIALETTEALGSVAAAHDGELLAELQLDPRQRSAESLAPGLRSLLETVHWQPGDVELVAVTVGPGSFTGLRVGVTTAKTFAYAVGAQILGVDTLHVIAAGVPAGVQTLSAAIDAQRREVVAQRFCRDAEMRLAPAGPQELLPVDAWLNGLTSGTAVAGPVLEKLRERLPSGVSAVDPRFWRPTAAEVARLAARHYAAGRRDDLWSLVPRYSRPSAAEEKWNKARTKDA
jgi:tRNA threonylcarbamoyladenosine biosynthesis protein TsaB